MTTQHSKGWKWVNLHPRASAKERGGAQDDWPIKPDAISKRKEKEEKDGREKGKWSAAREKKRKNSLTCSSSHENGCIVLPKPPITHTHLGRKTLSAPIGRLILLHISFLCMRNMLLCCSLRKGSSHPNLASLECGRLSADLDKSRINMGEEGERRGRKEIHFIDRVTLPLLREQKKDLSWVKTLIYG